MNIYFDNFVTINNLNINKKEIAFKGNEIDKPQNKQYEIPPCNYTSVQIHPVAVFNMQLIKDGYTMEQIQESGVLYTTHIKEFDFGNPKLLEMALQGKITKDDIFSKSLKSNDDVKAMQRSYALLKEKFNTEDIRQHVAEFNKLENDIAMMLSKKGIDIPRKTSYSAKSMILSLLHYVNKQNEPLLKELLEDNNFNNLYIRQALMSLDENKDMKYSMQVLKMAQEYGYKKEFSEPLSILISEANGQNIAMIEKMFDEQEFLSQNSDFVSTKLMNFLRNAGTGLSLIYVQDDDITLKEVQELLEMEEAEE